MKKCPFFTNKVLKLCNSKSENCQNQMVPYCHQSLEAVYQFYKVWSQQTGANLGHVDGILTNGWTNEGIT